LGGNSLAAIVTDALLEIGGSKVAIFAMALALCRVVSNWINSLTTIKFERQPFKQTKEFYYSSNRGAKIKGFQVNMTR